MKNKLSIRFKLLALILTGVPAFSACKKGGNVGSDKPVTYHPNSILSSWSAQPHVDGVDNLLFFSPDSTFILSIANYNPGSVSVNWAKGKFKVKGDSVSLVITERRTRVNEDPFTVTTVNEKLYDKATFKIKNDQLIINYTGNAAGSPISATATYIYLPPAL